MFPPSQRERRGSQAQQRAYGGQLGYKLDVSVVVLPTGVNAKPLFQEKSFHPKRLPYPAVPSLWSLQILP